MRTDRRLYAFLVSLFFAAGLSAAKAEEALPSRPLPAFESLPAATAPAARRYATKVLLATPRARLYRTVISTEGRKEPNFAGHYRVVTWGCGTDCHGFAIVDRMTGRVFTPPSIEYVQGMMGNDEPRIDFRPDSRLLVLNGMLNENEGDEGKFFYEWTGKRLKLLARFPLPKEDPASEAPEER
jgi:hypothetical protein